MHGPGEGFTPEGLRLLALLLGAPDGDSLTTLRELRPRHPWLQPAVDELAEIPLAQWQAEHTRLFVNGYPATPCAPFESIYRHGQMQGPACDELQRLYAAAGVAPAGDLPADYLGTMLAFAAWLLEQGTPEAGDRLRVLRQGHLGLWLPAFGARLRQESRLRLYRQLGRRLGAWIPEAA